MMTYPRTVPPEPDPVTVPDDLAALAVPKFTRLDGVNTLNLCDKHPTVFAVVEITMPSGFTLEFCGNCARKYFGYEHTSKAVQENRQKGSAN